MQLWDTIEFSVKPSMGGGGNEAKTKNYPEKEEECNTNQDLSCSTYLALLSIPLASGFSGDNFVIAGTLDCYFWSDLLGIKESAHLNLVLLYLFEMPD